MFFLTKNFQTGPLFKDLKIIKSFDILKPSWKLDFY